MRNLLCLATLVATLGTFSLRADAPYPPQLVDWVKSSQIIFRGTVARLGASSEPSVTEELDHMAVIHVDEMIDPPAALAGYKGEITVRFDGKPPVAEGDRDYFFSQAWIVGQSLVVLDVAHVEAAPYPSLAKRVKQIHKFLSDKKLSDRLQGSEAVVVGKVIDTRFVGRPIGSEHDPLWTEATVEVMETLSGKARGTVAVRFAASMDIAHFHQPKLAVGETAILLLQKDTESGVSGEAYLVSNPLDKQPVAVKAEIEALLANPPVKPTR